MVVILLLGAHLSLLYSHRALLFEQRASANQWRASLAQEAAEAGLEWALARLNDPQARDGACLPVSATPGAAQGGSPLRQRWTASLATAAPLQPACVHTGTAWQCHCPDSGAGSASPPDPAVDHPAFGVSLAKDSSHAGLFIVTATGCSSAGPGCGRPGGPTPDARHHITATLAPLGQMSRPPLAPVTSLGPVTLGQEATVVNSDPATGGVAIHSGSTIDIQAPARALGPPGQPVAAGLVANDASLQAGADTIWRRLFGMDRSTLSALPGWEHLGCGGGCTDADVAAALGRGARTLWIDGDLTTGAATGSSAAAAWGSADAPVLLVVGGTARLGAGLQMQGLLVAEAVQAGGAGARSELRGALLSLGATRLGGSAALDVQHDAAVLGRLTALGGVLAMVPGSWFDPHD